MLDRRNAKREATKTCWCIVGALLVSALSAAAAWAQVPPAIETELRRMARIFDAFFLLSTPPKNEGAPSAVDVRAASSRRSAMTRCACVMYAGVATIISLR